jgi:diadenosine tetraphosphate (Ap4A) HIT family hydrolase
MEPRAWPESFRDQRRGVRCVLCEEGRVDETGGGIRYFSGETCDAYLQRKAPSPGYSVVIFRGRHVAGPEQMTPGEHALLWSEVACVARAIEKVFLPLHLNYQILGNINPHLHVHIVPRYDPDPAPSLPLPDVVWEQCAQMSTEESSMQIRLLKQATSE